MSDPIRKLALSDDQFHQLYISLFDRKVSLDQIIRNLGPADSAAKQVYTKYLEDIEAALDIVREAL